MIRFIIFMALVCLIHSCCAGQATINAGVGYYSGKKLNATAGLGYDYKRYTAAAELRTNQFSNGTYFGLTGGYTIPLGAITLNPYAGYWWHKVGSTSSVDRYVDSAGHTTVLASGLPVNGNAPGGGLRVLYRVFYIEAAYVGRLQGNLGVKFKL